MSRSFATASVWVVATLAVVAAVVAAELPRELLQRAVDATVYIKANRVYAGSEVATTGSGFFIDRRGIILTNDHVVADRLEAHVWGRTRSIDAAVHELKVVLNSGRPDQRELDARVIARDPERDLALLQVQAVAPAVIEVAAREDLALADRVWGIGFPLGGLLDVSDRAPGVEEPNPSPTLSSGMVTSLRRSAEGDLRLLQTDASINPGSSGGPLIDGEGALAGVIVAKITEAEALGFAVPAGAVWSFVFSKAITIRFEPSVVPPPPQPITVTVEPLLEAFALRSVRARVSADGAESAWTPLERRGERWVGAIMPERVGEAASYVATVELHAADGRALPQRRFRLQVPSDVPKLASGSEAAERLEDRKLFPNEVIASDPGTSPGLGGRRSLADLAGSVTLSDNRVIDDSSLRDLNTRTYGDECYERLKTEDRRWLARQFDQARSATGDAILELIEVDAEIQRFRTIEHFDSYADYRYRDENLTALYKQRRLLVDRINRLSPDVWKQLPVLIVNGLCLCERRIWVDCDDPGCGDPMRMRQPSR